MMPKEEKQLDLKSGRIRRKAVFEEKENSDGESDEEDDQDEEMSEDEMAGSDSDEEGDAEEGSDKELPEQEADPRNVKRLKREETKEETVMELPAFADSDDDLEMSSVEEGETGLDESNKETDEEDEQESDEKESSDCDSESADKKLGEPTPCETSKESKELRGNHKQGLNLDKKVFSTVDSGNCTAEEVSESESESSSLDEDAEEDEEAEELHRKRVQSTQEVSTLRQAKLKAVEDDENLLKEEEEYEEKTDFSADTAGIVTHVFLLYVYNCPC